MSTEANSGRIHSMDQFRGYTVAGMFVVNFLGGMEAIHSLFKHNNTYFSYADSIMPSFMFACGFSYRLSMLRRLARIGQAATWRHAIVRGLALVLVSVMMFGFGDGFKSWSQMTSGGVHEFIAKLLKANLWEVLAIIGMTQILILPVITAGPRVRLLATLGLVVANVVLADLFNWNFVHGLPNLVSDYWGAARSRAWDGGAFGLLGWAIPMLAGTLAYDVMAASPPVRSARTFLAWGAVLMGIGYAFSCLTTLYDVDATQPPAKRAELADSPVRPPLARIKGRSLSSLLAEPPFVAPPPASTRQHNYWMMGKRMPSMTFTVFSTGFALAVYALFILGSDVGSLRVRLFNTLGQNALVAYLIHHAVETTIHAIVPKDSPLGWCLTGLVLFLGITYLFVDFLERRSIHVRL
ncbi:Protein of unknown function [Singulisphaera sp. GP187]|uniref:heparan-alpha-glucosaminide N-acetyltransferase domain-containing protein n=1 Tax=Singulisphaera sp. GP187 TaxID=1882752 RepID=UPI00092C4927|nr:heparan-alpha-glucosaminide N-acetyltransferase domain-containing protein [Singulisphaera sp. GP187]SIO58510.1 Protein of unknown function [Singulisphaera sp. GP187]